MKNHFDELHLVMSTHQIVDSPPDIVITNAGLKPGSCSTFVMNLARRPKYIGRPACVIFMRPSYPGGVNQAICHRQNVATVRRNEDFPGMFSNN
jgi:hypothetical protein